MNWFQSLAVYFAS